MVSAIADGPDEVRQAVREELRRGADQIKVMASGGVMSPTDPLTSVQYSLAEISAAVQAAQAVGTYVLAHAYTAEAVQICAEAGVRSIEHGNLIDEETARFMAMRGTFLVPTLVTYERLHTEGPSHGIGPDRLHKLGAVLDAGLESLEMAQRNGVKIGSGSDLFGQCAVTRATKWPCKPRHSGPWAPSSRAPGPTPSFSTSKARSGRSSRGSGPTSSWWTVTCSPIPG